MDVQNEESMREKRRSELMEMWKERGGRQAVLSLFHRALPDGEVARAGMSVFDVILESEFSTPEVGEHL